MDSDLNLKSHTKTVRKSAFYHLKDVSWIQGPKSQQDLEKLINAFIFSCINYCNMCGFDYISYLMETLQLQNCVYSILTEYDPSWADLSTGKYHSDDSVDDSVTSSQKKRKIREEHPAGFFFTSSPANQTADFQSAVSFFPVTVWDKCCLFVFFCSNYRKLETDGDSRGIRRSREETRGPWTDLSPSLQLLTHCRLRCLYSFLKKCSLSQINLGFHFKWMLENTTS